MILNLFAGLVLLSAIAAPAQNAAKGVFLTDKSTVPKNDLSKSLRKECPDVRVVNDAAKSDYTLEALSRMSRPGLGIEHVDAFDFNLLDNDGIAFGTSTTSLGDAVKDLCRAIRKSIRVEVVDTQNLTQSTDARGDTSGGAVAAVVNGLTGRRTHTDASTINVVVNGEHALLDCYELRTGCTTIGPGKYYGEQNSDGVWITYRTLTHKWGRNHYKVAGSW